MVGVDRRDVVPAGGDLGRGRVPVQDPDEQLVDQLRVVRLAADELGDLVGRVGDRVAERRAADQGHDRAELHPARPLALAGALADGPAERGQEPARQLDPRVGQGRRPDPRRRRRGTSTTSPVTRYTLSSKHLGRQPTGQGVRVVHLVVLVPLVRGDRELVRPRRGDQPHDVPDVEPRLDELGRQVVEQLGVRGRVARADVVDRLDDPGAEQVAPEPVDVAPGEVRVVGRRQPRRPAPGGGSAFSGALNVAGNGNFGGATWPVRSCLTSPSGLS